MIALGDPVGTGLVDSLAEPGGNVTGMSAMLSELAAKRLALLTGAVPGISRVLVLSYLADPIAPLQVKALKEAAPSLGVALQIQDIRLAMTFRRRSTLERGSAPKRSYHGGEHVRCSPRTSERARGPLPTARDVPLLIQVIDGGGLMANDKAILISFGAPPPTSTKY